ncbi:hypothetical protein C4N9_13800 [Pararhodobacter marinus]|uniref:SGNH/GDSL hydrolase family protein n=1 Tax=Pararhodobacter marinus TaxID=2184063 RepID=A0A2U2C7T6_9RHOB|nr:hypothetical protein [Pararhodobacter marinus]PWE27927.1 hypothetical protein C4N9_13800 [Pararhodobacter marinus]
MTRLVILGNSHLGALRAALRDEPALAQGTEIAFFGGIAPVFKAMTLGPDLRFGLFGPHGVAEANVEQTKKLFGGTSIDLNKADTVAIAGIAWHVWPLIDLLDRYAVDGLTATEEAGDNALRLSRPAFDAVLAALAEASLAPFGWTRSLGKPVRLLLRPVPPETLITEGKPGTRPERATRRGFAQALSLLEHSLTETGARLGLGVVVQPAQTRAASGWTLAEYQRGAVRLAPGARAAPAQKDNEHMNTAYGAACLTDLLTRITAETHPSGPDLAPIQGG